MGKLLIFWQDKWLLNSTLAETFPALYSHSVCPAISVYDAMHTPMEEQLRPRLTRCATEEKQMLQDCLLQVVLTDNPDVHSLVHRPSAPCLPKEVYHALQSGQYPDPDAYCLWRTKLPTKVKFLVATSPW
jgi:hypothetical protein